MAYDLSVDKKEPIKFGKLLGSGIFWWILQHCKMGHFSTHPWKIWSDLRKNFIRGVCLDKRVSVRYIL